MRRLLILPVLLALAAAAFAQRSRTLLDFAWKFHLGNAADPRLDFGWGEGWGLIKAGAAEGAADPNFDDSAWRTVNLPHDWANELPYVQNPDPLHIDHSSKPLGRDYPATSIGWYRRRFDIPASDDGRRVSIEFEGVYRNCRVWLNGHLLGQEESGYAGFAFDVSDCLNYGASNVLVVRVDATQFEGWFYEGAGIYRHVWLLETPPVHVARYGTCVTSKIGPDESQAAAREKRPNPQPPPPEYADLHIQTTVANDSNQEVSATLASEIQNSKGESVETGTATAKIPAWSSATVNQKVRLRRPELWSPDRPSMYNLVSTVSAPGSADRCETPFGIRSIRFDPNQGFFLNGERIEIKGTCDHQDAAGVGAAVPDALWNYRIADLKSFGSNAYRTAHNPPAPELLDACDRLGMMVVDENRLIGSQPWNEELLREMILRDRNHPSVILWSLGNEEWEEGQGMGARIAASMVRVAHQIDPSRPTTFAANDGDEYRGINPLVDVRGWNYIKNGDIDAYHKAYPNQPIIGTEDGGTFATRGEYANDASRGIAAAYAQEGPKWGSTPQEWWSYFASRPYLAGGFVWAGFDYRGTPTPYSWPSIASYYGIFDSCGFPKDSAWYYRAWWTDRPVLHLVPNWNWAGKEGQPIDVWCYGNATEVELFLNGKSLGRKPMPPNGYLDWKVPYQPGALEARGYQKGQVVATAKEETAGAPTALVLTPDRAQIAADGEDVSVITVSALDAQGRPNPTASNEVAFQVTGGHIVGVANGDPTSHENDVYLPVDLTLSAAGWRYNASLPDDITPFLDPDYDDSDWRATSADGDADQLSAGDTALFRGYIDLPGIEKGSKVILTVGKLGDGAQVFVNGGEAGHAGTAIGTNSFEVEDFVQPGRNRLAVYFKKAKGADGLGGGIAMRILGPPPVWHRALFNGLAQLLVQSDRTPGAIKITATSSGLKAAQIVVDGK